MQKHYSPIHRQSATHIHTQVKSQKQLHAFDDKYCDYDELLKPVVDRRMNAESSTATSNMLSTWSSKTAVAC